MDVALDLASRTLPQRVAGGHRTSGLVQPHAEIEPDLYESLTTLAYAAAATRTIRLGTAILVLPLRDPRVVARQIIAVQALSRGRLSLGIGSGDYPTEFRVMQAPYQKKAAYTREHLDALRAILPGGRADYRRERVAFENGSFFPRVAPIPILMGGGIRANPRTGGPELFEPPLRTLARTCDGWIPDAISSRQTGRHVGKALETAGHGRRGATGMGCTRGRSQDRAGEGEAGGWVRGAWSGGARG